MKRPANIQKLLALTASAALGITDLTVYADDGHGHDNHGFIVYAGDNHGHDNHGHDNHGLSAFRGTDIVHLSIQTRVANEGIVTNASGFARIDWNQQGNANHQDLQVSVRGLDAEADYQLAAQLDDDTNLTSVITFSTDANGNACVFLEDKGQGENGHGHGHAYGHDKHGHGKPQLPAGLEPVGQIHQLLVLDDSGTNVVLSADFTTASCFQYLVKRNIGSDTVNAELWIIASAHKAQIRLFASGLDAGSDYTLALNDTAAQTETADDQGRVSIRAELSNPGDILSVSSVSLLDAGTNVVVSTTLP